jgi:hypothetical protein
MRSNHKICPICQSSLHEQTCININLPLNLSSHKLSYKDVNCNIPSLETNYHTFREITSLYGEVLCEQVCFPNLKLTILNNYIDNKTVISFIPRENIDYKIPDKLVLEKVMKIDYSNIEKLINRLKTLRVLL